MTSRFLLIAGLVGLIASAPALAEPQLTPLREIDRQLRTAEGQISQYLGSIQPPSRQLTANQLAKRLVDGMVLYRLNDFARAAVVLMDIVTRHAGTAEATEAAFFLADSMFQQRELITAQIYFRKVVDAGGSSRYYQLALQRLLELEMRRMVETGLGSDPERLRLIAELLAKIEAIPTGSREPSVDYVRGKYLFFVKRYADALQIFASLGPTHPYYLQAVYFTGVCHVQEGRYHAAAQLYQQLIDKVVFGYLKPKTATDRLLLQQVVLAAARLAYYRGGPKDLEQAVEYYNAIPRQSKLYSDALYESAWAYLKVKRYDRAMVALELLQAANPAFERSDEARVLLGNLRLHRGDFTGAKALFRTASEELLPVFQKLRGLQAEQIDTKVIFEQITSKNPDLFDIRVRLPRLALDWLRRDPEVKRALLVVEDLAVIRQLVAESNELIRTIERQLQSGSLVGAFPQLALAQARATDIDTFLTRIQGELSQHLRRLLLPVASAEERGALERLQSRRKQLEGLLAGKLSSAGGVQAHLKQIQALFDKIDGDAHVTEIEIKELETMLRAVVDYYERTYKDQRIPRGTMDHNRKVLGEQIAVMKSLIKSMREDIRDAQAGVGVGDSVQRDETKIRAELQATLAREQQIAAQVLARMSPAQRQVKAELDGLIQRAEKAGLDVKAVFTRVEEYVAAKRVEITQAIAQEKANLMGYQQQLAAYAPEGRETVGGVTYENFRRVSKRVYSVLVKADVGVLDVVWAIKNLTKTTYEQRDSELMKALEMLKEKYREARGEP